MADPWTGAYDPRGAEGGGNWSGFDRSRSTPIPLVANFAPGYQHSARWGTSGTPRFFTGYTGDPSSWYGQVFGGEAPEGRLARYAQDEQSFGMAPEEAWQHAFGRVYRMMQETGRDPSALAAGIPAQYRAAAPAAPAPGGGATTLYQHLNMALDPMQETFYQVNNPLLWGAVGHQFAPNTEAPRGDWWRQRYTQAQADYANATAQGTNPNLSFVSWLNSQYPQISQEFGLLPAAARGESNPYLASGRPQL
jgi:hypothetical protein